MPFVSIKSDFIPNNPIFCGILANTLLSTVPGLSGAGPNPQGTLLTPILDAELILNGAITSCDATPNTPTGCPTPASITCSMMQLCQLTPLFINAGLVHTPTIPCMDVYGKAGLDPRYHDAVPDAEQLFLKGKQIGTYLSASHDLIVLGESVPGGTTTALCILRALGYPAQVSSAFAKNPNELKESIVTDVLTRLHIGTKIDGISLITKTGDPMMAVAAGIAASFTKKLYFAGGTQMLAVCAVLKIMNIPLPDVITTIYVSEDVSANVCTIAQAIGVRMIIVDPDFGRLSHDGLKRYCIGEVKEGMGAGGAMYLAHMMGYTPDCIRSSILQTVQIFSPYPSSSQ